MNYSRVVSKLILNAPEENVEAMLIMIIFMARKIDERFISGFLVF